MQNRPASGTNTHITSGRLYPVYKDSPMDCMGVDLGCSALSKGATSAVAILDDAGGLVGKPQHFRKATELQQIVSQYNPASLIVAVDAPRSVPDHTEENYAYRSCEQGIKAIDKGAGSFYGAAALYIRWYELESEYLQNIKVIETYPRIVWKVLGLPETPKNFPRNRDEVCSKVGELVNGSCVSFTLHQVDAVLCAYTAFCYVKGEISWFGKPGEGLIITPAAGEPQALPQDVEYIEERFRRFPSMR